MAFVLACTPTDANEPKPANQHAGPPSTSTMVLEFDSHFDDESPLPVGSACGPPVRVYASLVNVGDGSVRVVSDDFWQPVHLIVRDAEGREIAPVDLRRFDARS